ncbi:MAG: hypothetical protein ACLFQX_01830 [Candidatus Kapaibacterium sp.]
MSYSRLIHEYLDGGLSGAQEELLFAELGKDQELRHDFNQQLKLHLIAQSDMKSIAPPTDSTNYIFSSLGFAMPSADYQHSLAAGRSSGSTVWTRLRKRLVPILALLLLISIPGYFALDMIGGADERSAAQSASIAKGSSAPLSESTSPEVQYGDDLALAKNGTTWGSPDDEKSGNNEKSTAINSKSNKSQNKSRAAGNGALATLSRGNSAANSETVSGMNDMFNSASGEISASSIFASANSAPGERFGVANPGFATNLRSGLSQYDPFIYNNDIMDYSNGYADRNFSIAINYASLSSFPDFTIPSAAGEMAANAEITGLYKLSVNHWIGVEIGIDRFNQAFDYMNAGMPESYRQSPELWYYGVAYRLAMPEMIVPYAIYPYADIFAGGTVAGPYFKGEAGINWRVTPHIDFSIAYKYGRLIYNVQNEIYFSDKMGLNYSLSYNF